MSVHKLSGKRWYFQFYFEGKKYKRTTWNNQPINSKAEATTAESEFKEQLAKEKDRINGKMTLYELFDDFVKSAKSNLKITAIKNYNTFRNAYLPLINDINIHELKQSHIVKWRDSLADASCSIDFKNRILSIMKSMLEYAHIVYELKSNLQQPLLEKFKDTTIKAIEQKEKSIPESKFNEMLSLLDLTVDSDFYYFTILKVLYNTGLRIGELAALTINDYKDNYLIVNKAYSRVNGKDIVLTPKTSNSIRYVLLDNSTIDSLNAYINRFKPVGVLFHRNKKYITQQRVREKLKQLADAVGLTDYEIKIHNLRHSHATNLRQLGFDEFAIAKRLGNTPQVSATTYIHSTDEDMLKIIEKMNK